MPSPTNQCRSEEHTSELQSPDHLVCRLLLEKKKNSRRWIFLPGRAALDEAVQDIEQLTQQRSERLWVFQRLVSVRRTFSYPRYNQPPIKPPCRARAARAPFPPA